MSQKKAYARIIEKELLQKSNKSFVKYIPMAVAFTLFLFAGTILYLTVKAEPVPSRGEVIRPENMDAVLEQMNESGNDADTSYEVIMSTSWTFETGDSVSRDAYVENSANNRNTVYFIVNLAGEELPIYVSPHLPVGSATDEIQLNTALAAGEYDATLTYYLLDESDACVSTIPVRVKITVGE